MPSTAKEACARQFRRHNDERPSTSWTRDTPGTPRRAIGPPGAAPGAARKTRSQASDPVSVSAYLCNFLHDRGIKPAKVLKNAGVIHDTQADWHRGDAVHALYMAALPLMPQHITPIVRLLLPAMPLSLSLTLTLIRFVGSVQGLFSCFFFPFVVSSGFTRGGLVTHNLSSLPRLASFL